MKKILDYMDTSEKCIVSPIWDGERFFYSLCMGHLEISKALGFELERISDSLTIVKEGQVRTKEQLEQVLKKKEFDYSVFEWDVNYLKGMKASGINQLWGGGCFGPLTVVSGILGAENMLRLIVKDPELVENFVDYVTEFLIVLAMQETSVGGDFFWISEPVASLLAPKHFWRFCGKYLKKIYDAAEVPGILHVCGNTTKHTTLLEETGAEVLSVDYCTDIGACIRMVNPNTIIMGNVSPANLRFGTKEDVKEEVKAILDACSGYRNFILSTGCIIMEGNAVREYGSFV